MPSCHIPNDSSPRTTLLYPQVGAEMRSITTPKGISSIHHQVCPRRLPCCDLLLSHPVPLD